MREKEIKIATYCSPPGLRLPFGNVIYHSIVFRCCRKLVESDVFSSAKPQNNKWIGSWWRKKFDRERKRKRDSPRINGKLQMSNSSRCSNECASKSTRMKNRMNCKTHVCLENFVRDSHVASQICHFRHSVRGFFLCPTPRFASMADKSIFQWQIQFVFLFTRSLFGNANIKIDYNSMRAGARARGNSCFFAIDTNKSRSTISRISLVCSSVFCLLRDYVACEFFSCVH